MAYAGLIKNTNLMSWLNQNRNFEECSQIMNELKTERSSLPLEDKLGWYFWHWKDPNSIP